MGKKKFDRYSNALSIKIFNKPYDLLTISEIQQVIEYSKDLLNPEIKPIIINDKQTGYFVTNIGEIYDRNRVPIKQYTNSGGYKTCWLRGINENKKWSTPILVHRMVAQAFIPNPDNKEEINHRNCDTTFNWVGNLEWVTHDENIKYSDHLGHRVCGIQHKNAKCTEEQIHQVCKLLEKDTMAMNDISRVTGVPLRTITHIRFGNGWSHISSQYNIPKEKKRNGPRFSPISLQIIDEIKNGKSNDEIFADIKKSELSIGVSDKSIRDRIYHARLITNSQAETSTTIDQH